MNYVIQPKFALGHRVITTEYQTPGEPMFKGRIVRVHWHSARFDDGGNDPAYFTYSVVFSGSKPVGVIQEKLLRME